METVKLILPLPPNVANMRGSGKARHFRLKAWHTQALTLLAYGGERFPDEPWKRTRVRCDFYLKNRMDADNLVTRQKPILDLLKCTTFRFPNGMVERTRGFFLDDSPEHIELKQPAQVIDRKKPRVEVTLERIE